jgi:tripartite-type tricarboxylate transporter receptor subunit TctC
VIGTESVARAPADGYTLLTVGPSHVINAALRSKLPYDPIKDFAPITQFANTASVLLVHPSVPGNSVKELIALAQREPGRIPYGSAGNGSSPHLHAEMFKSMAQVDLVHVPYKGSTQARTDLLSGRVQVVFDGLLPSLPHIKAGKLRALGVTNSRRAAIVPDVPTIAEAGVPGYQADTWYGLVAPSGTPPDIVERLHAAVSQALTTATLRDKLAAQGAEVVGSTPAAFAKLIDTEREKWTRIVRASGAKVD